MTKVEHYDWAKPGDSGRQMRIKLDALNIDSSYQRDEVSDVNTLAIARDFKWSAFGTIVVFERANGAYYVVDGQQRTLAAKRRGDIDSVPCIVFHSDGKEMEARAFLALNTRRKNVPAVAKFMASVRAAINPEYSINAWIQSRGLRIVQDGKSLNGINFVATLVQHWRADEESSKDAIIVQSEISGGQEPLSGACHKGLWWLRVNNVDIKSSIVKLRRMGGVMAMVREITRVQIELGQSSSDRVCGIGILRLINHKSRNKIVVEDAATGA